MTYIPQKRLLTLISLCSHVTLFTAISLTSEGKSGFTAVSTILNYVTAMEWVKCVCHQVLHFTLRSQRGSHLVKGCWLPMAELARLTCQPAKCPTGQAKHDSGASDLTQLGYSLRLQAGD